MIYLYTSGKKPVIQKARFSATVRVAFLENLPLLFLENLAGRENLEG